MPLSPTPGISARLSGQIRSPIYIRIREIGNCRWWFFPWRWLSVCLQLLFCWRENFPLDSPAGFGLSGRSFPSSVWFRLESQSMADRYTYVPLIGVFTVLVWGLGAVCAGRRVPGPLITFLAMTVLVACAFRTRDQLRYWQNDETLFRHTLAVTKNNYLAYNNLGTWLSKKGRITEAMDCFHKSLQIKPDDSDVLYNLGNAFAKLGNWDEAINNYQRALEIIPNQPDILDNLGFAFAARKQFADAIVCFEAALKLDPDSADAHNNLATVLFIQKKLDEAIRHYREAIRLMPDDPQFHSNLGDALVKQGQTAEAVRCYQAALQLKPGDAKIQAKLQALGMPVSN